MPERRFQKTASFMLGRFFGNMAVRIKLVCITKRGNYLPIRCMNSANSTNAIPNMVIAKIVFPILGNT